MGPLGETMALLCPIWKTIRLNFGCLEAVNYLESTKIAKTFLTKNRRIKWWWNGTFRIVTRGSAFVEDKQPAVNRIELLTLVGLPHLYQRWNKSSRADRNLDKSITNYELRFPVQWRHHLTDQNHMSVVIISENRDKKIYLFVLFFNK